MAEPIDRNVFARGRLIDIDYEGPIYHLKVPKNENDILLRFNVYRYLPFSLIIQFLLTGGWTDSYGLL